MKIKLANHITLIQPPDSLIKKIRSTFIIENPTWISNERMHRWNGGTPRWLACYGRDGDSLLVPRGAKELVLWFCKELNIRFEFVDNRWVLPQVGFTFNGVLKGYQEQAVSNVLSHDFNVLQAPTGSGKTVMALSVIAERKQPALIIVHSKELLNQWLDRIETFLSIPRNEIGIIGNGKNRIGKKITVGIINSIYPVVRDIRQHFGHIIVDECHRTPSRTFTEAVSAFDCKCMLGLSATPYRRDGLTKLIGWYLGRKIEIKQANLTEQDIVLNVEVITRETDFTSWSNPSDEYAQMLSELTGDEDRNRLIVNDVAKEASNGGGVCLILSDRKSHCEAINSMLSETGIAADVLTGDTRDKEREAIVGRLNSGNVKVLVATGQLIGEGFDCRGLSTLFLATPIKFSGRLIQYLGRILRPAPGKGRARVYDFIDVNIGVLRASAKQRQRVYQLYQPSKELIKCQPQK
jgi:superfamily II DNA or RNA helicase